MTNRFFGIFLFCFSLTQVITPTGVWAHGHHEHCERRNGNDGEAICCLICCALGIGLGAYDAATFNDLRDRTTPCPPYAPLLPYPHSEQHNAHHEWTEGGESCGTGCGLGQCVGYTAGCAVCLIPRLGATAYLYYRDSRAGEMPAPPQQSMNDQNYAHPPANPPTDAAASTEVPSSPPPTYLDAISTPANSGQ